MPAVKPKFQPLGIINEKDSDKIVWGEKSLLQNGVK